MRPATAILPFLVALAVPAFAGVVPVDPGAFLSDEIRVRVDATGLWRIDVADLIDHDFPLDVPRRFLRFYQKRGSDPLDAAYPGALGAEVPIFFAGDPDPDGMVQPADVVIFHGLGPEDDVGSRLVDGDLFPAAMPRRPDNYNTFNVYWVVAADPGEGRQWGRMAAESLLPAQGSPQPWYRRVERFSGDRGYQPNPVSLADPRYHWNGSMDVEVLRDLMLHHPVAGRQVEVTWTLVRRPDTVPFPLRMVCSLVQGGNTSELATIDVSASPWRRLTPTTVSLPSDDLENGLVSFRMVNESGAAVATFLGEVTLEYDAYYGATGEVAAFHTGQIGGEVDLEVPGFSDPSLLLFEVTNPHRPRRIPLSASNLQHRTPEELFLSLRVAQGVDEQRRFVAMPLQAIERIPAAQLSRDAVADVIEATPVAQALAIGPEAFSSSVQTWLDWRRAHDLFGWAYEFVDVQQIYDQFSGGLESPTAIKAFTQYAYVNWGARALLLVGDASEDARTIETGAGPHHVPSHLHLHSTFQTQLVASDKWYGIFCEDPTHCSDYPLRLTRGPDMLVGRLPAADPAQLDDMIAKIVGYEQPASSDDWRRRTLWVSDDPWSTDDFVTSCYRYRAAEEAFALAQQANADLVANSLDAVVDGVLWDLDAQIDPAWRVPVTCPGGETGSDRSLVAQQVANFVQTPFQELLGGGYLLVSYQGHSSSRVLTHEALFQTIHVPNLSNDERPFLFLGMGASICDFVRSQEATVGPSMGESLLRVRGAGAVATYGSTTLEYLTSNEIYTALLTENFFDKGRAGSPVLGSLGLPSQWVLGDQLAQSDHDLMATVTPLNAQTMAQYNLLGDPLLRMDAAPPRIEVRVNGEILPAGGAVSADAALPTFTATLDLVDESGLSRVEVVDSEGRDHTASVTWISAPPDPRRRQATVELPTYPAGYSFEVRVYDGSYPRTRPAVRSYEVPGSVGVASLDLRVRVDGQEVAERGGELPMGRTSAVEIDLRSSAPLRADEIAVSLEGAHLSRSSVRGVDGSGHAWKIALEAEARPGDTGQVIVLALAETETRFVLREPISADLRHYAHPNPSMSATTVSFGLSRPGRVRVRIYDLAGRHIQTLLDEERLPGRHAVIWEGTDSREKPVSRGVYFYEIEIPGRRLRGKILQIR